MKAKLLGLLNIVLFISFLILAASTFLMHSSWLNLNWREIHETSGYAVIWLSLLHIVLHYRYFLCIPRILKPKSGNR